MGLAQVIMMVLALVTLGTGVVLNQRNTYPEVLSEAHMETEEPVVVATLEPTSTPSSTSSPTIMPSVAPSPTPQSENLSDLFYPGASVVSITGNTARLTSNSNPDEIFNWYLNKFREKNLNAISSSKTSVNNNFQAKLAGANNELNIEVEIKEVNNQAEITLRLGQ